ncbi:MAG: hypothetical protein IJK67_03585 [Bacilli bacterium]|nr:hypothetical protein [Bacilli bacterium]
MNKIRVYNDDEIKILLGNSNVERIRNKCHIVYKNSFKLWAVKEKLSDTSKTARQIFVAGGFDMNILDDRTPQKRICSWVKKYKKFGEDYFTDKNKYTYKAIKTNNTETKFLSKTFNDPKFIALVIEKKDNGKLDYRVIRKLDDEKDNSKS